MDRARAEMQHQDQQELGDYGGPRQHPSRVYSDEIRLTQGAARRGLSDRQATAWTMTGGHQDSPTKGASGEIRRGAGVVKSRAESPGAVPSPILHAPSTSKAHPAKAGVAKPRVLALLSDADLRVSY